ncbi:hypothetical protein QBC37DRAFT_301293 [Rhypophila decipiens]|uniref:Reverse transcriptase Ty1/copia-type domain-containing protein n=1 Tax=Rhypophila decipiens TaxID=261697 RepID=A0AAN6XUY2_9PEZI|nr:hypothetical protein QBC37DRAFT_301293 [Rhypophila decipiens]
MVWKLSRKGKDLDSCCWRVPRRRSRRCRYGRERLIPEGAVIERNRTERRLWLHQRAYIDQAVRHFNVSLNPPKVPLSPGLVSSSPSSGPLQGTDIWLYQQLVGTVMYAVTQTRADSAFSIQWLSRHLQKPCIAHLNAVIRLLSHLGCAKDLAIELGSTSNVAPVTACSCRSRNSSIRHY